MKQIILAFIFVLLSTSVYAGTSIPFTINLSKAVSVTGAPRIAVDVGGVTRYATYTSGSGTSALTFTYSMIAGDVDLDGVTVSSPIGLNGGTIKDLVGNDLSPLTFTPPNTTNVKVNYPSLGMDFVYDADGRYTLNGTPYNDLPSFLSAAGGSFTRASVGTYFDSAGTLQTAASGAPRFDYDPVTHAQKGILIEEARTNMLIRSTEFDNAIWTKQTSSITANTSTAPDGSLTADKLIEDTSNAEHATHQSNTLTAAPYTFSFYAKAGERSWVYARFDSGSPKRTWFNLSTGTVGTIDATHTANITPVGSGWYRCSVTATANATTWYSIILTSTGNNTAGYTGDGTSGVYIWGTQTEQGAFPTSYIPTTTAAVTRAADSLTVPTGTWFNSGAGSLFAEFDRSGQGSGGYGTAGMVVQMRTDDANATDIFTANRNPVGSEIKFANTFPAFLTVAKTTGTSRAATTFNSAGGKVAIDGTTQSSGTSATIPNFSQLTIGRSNRSGGQNWLNTTIGKVKYYPSLMTDTQLQLMTQ